MPQIHELARIKLVKIGDPSDSEQAKQIRGKKLSVLAPSWQKTKRNETQNMRNEIS